MKISIIIPVKEINDYIYESIPKILDMDYSDFEIIILPNEDNISFEANKTRIIPSGNVGPAAKRNLGAQHANGKILAFLDDDAYPRVDWLTNAIKYFDDINIVGVGGPGITPDTDPFRAKVSGNVFLTKLGGGNPDRYIPGKSSYYTDDRPSVNLLIRKKDYIDIGGFQQDYWPGEDTKLCLDLIQTGKKIIYAPDVIVRHHRRPSISKHILQIYRYGLHRGHFAKAKDQNSKKLLYFIPSLFLLFLLIFGTLSFVNIYIKYLLISGISIYLLGLIIGFVDIYIKNKDILTSICTMPLIFITHIVYGYAFIRGFLKPNLKSKLR